MMDYNETSYTIVAAVASLLYVTFTWLRRYLENKKPFGDNLPMAPNSHWYWGHLSMHLAAGENWCSTLESLFVKNANKHGHVSHWIGKMRSISILDWKDAKAVLFAESDHLSLAILERYAKNLAGNNSILMLNGREWRIHRKPISRSFVPAAINESRNDIEVVMKDLVQTVRERMGSNQSIDFDMEKIVKMITLDVFGKAALSTDFGCCRNLAPSPVVSSFEFLTGDLIRRAQNPLLPTNFFYFIPTPNNLRHRREFKAVRSFLCDILKERRELSKNNKHSNKKDLLTNIMQAHVDEMELESDIDVDALLCDVLMTLFFAGYDTTSITLVYVLYILSKNPSIEQNCVEEINSLTSLNNPDELVYCKSVVLETLRLRPPAFGTQRSLQKPVKISGNFVIPKGTLVFVPIWFIHRDDRNFPKSMEFRPDRWAKRNSNKEANGGRIWVERDLADNTGSIPAGNRDAIFAFSGGGRNCPGAKFAMQEAVLVLAHLLKELKFSANPDFEIKSTRRLALQRPISLPMKVEIREAK